MFIVRLYCIDNIFYTYYELIPSHSSNLEPNIIHPILPQQYKYGRPFMFLFPAIASIAMNLYYLKTTKVNVIKLLKKYPQLLILSGFSPFIFEGKAITELSSKDETPIQISISASILNGVYIGIIPCIALLISESARGIVSLKSLRSTVYDVYASASLNLLFGSFMANSILAVSFIFVCIILLLYIFGFIGICVDNIKCAKEESEENIENIKCEKEESEEIENEFELFPRSEEKLQRIEIIEELNQTFLLRERSTSVRITAISRNIESKRRTSY